MKVLVLNSGSSSVKFEIIDTSIADIANNTEKKLGRGLVDKIGIPGSVIKFNAPGKSVFEKKTDIPDHTVALDELLRVITDPETGVLGSLAELDAVGHRMVHGAEHFAQSVIIDDNVAELIRRDCMTLAPLHVPANYKGYEVLKAALPAEVPHVAVFDTAFHQTMPQHAFMYAIPYSFYENFKVRRYGFHGSSHRYCNYIIERDIALKPVTEFNSITVHLGNGCSLTAIEKGKSIETSMGLTPLEGLMMGTRSGDTDPSVILSIMEHLNVDAKSAGDLLNKKSGLLGISGISNDMRELDAAADAGNERAALAVKMFAYRVRKYIGSYMAVLGTTDYIAFAGGIGENNPPMRKKILEGLEALGIKIDWDKNANCRETAVISTDDSPVKVCVINTDEEIVIARDTVRCLQK